jgi:hypothetical protein
MHLNKDNIYEQQVEFDQAVEVLRDNIKDYDIKKVKLVRRHFNQFILIFTITTHVPFTLFVALTSHCRYGFQ